MPYFSEYVKTYTDLPFLVTLRERGEAFAADKFLTAADLDAASTGVGEVGSAAENAQWKPVLLDAGSGRPVVPGGSIGFR